MPASISAKTWPAKIELRDSDSSQVVLSLVFVPKKRFAWDIRDEITLKGRYLERDDVVVSRPEYHAILGFGRYFGFCRDFNLKTAVNSSGDTLIFQIQARRLSSASQHPLKAGILVTPSKHGVSIPTSNPRQLYSTARPDFALEIFHKIVSESFTRFFIGGGYNNPPRRVALGVRHRCS